MSKIQIIGPKCNSRFSRNFVTNSHGLRGALARFAVRCTTGCWLLLRASRGDWEAVSRNASHEGCSPSWSWRFTLLTSRHERVHQLRLQLEPRPGHDWTSSDFPTQLQPVTVICCCHVPPSTGNDVTTVPVDRRNLSPSLPRVGCLPILMTKISIDFTV